MAEKDWKCAEGDFSFFSFLFLFFCSLSKIKSCKKNLTSSVMIISDIVVPAKNLPFMQQRIRHLKSVSPFPKLSNSEHVKSF